MTRINCIGRSEPTNPGEVVGAFDELVGDIKKMIAEIDGATFADVSASVMNRFERLAILGQRIGDRAGPADQRRIVAAIDRFNETVEAIARDLGLDVEVINE